MKIFSQDSGRILRNLKDRAYAARQTRVMWLLLHVRSAAPARARLAAGLQLWQALLRLIVLRLLPRTLLRRRRREFSGVRRVGRAGERQ